MSHPRLAGLAAVAAACALLACDGSTPSDSGGVPHVTPAQLALLPCEARQLDVSGVRASALTWTTSDSSVAVVSASGRVTAWGPGSATILGLAPGGTATVQVSVAAQPVTVTLSGGGSDTVQALLPQPLVATARYSASCPARRVVLHFDSQLRPYIYGDAPGAYFGTTPQSAGQYPFDQLTDADGRVQAYTALGPLAGSFRLRVGVRGQAPADSVQVTVAPGALAGIQAGPRDTAVSIGGTYALRLQAVDRFRNPRPDPVTVKPGTDVAAIEGGATVRGMRFGRVGLLVQAGPLADLLQVTVLPEGTIAAFLYPPTTGEVNSVVMRRLDGRGYRVLAVPPLPAGYNGHIPVDWSPDGSHVLYVGVLGGPLEVIDTLGGAPRRVITVDAPLANGYDGGVDWPQFTADGQWVLFASGWNLYRVASSGGSPELLFPAVERQGKVETHASASPDGTRLVAAQRDQDPGDFHVRIFGYASGDVIPGTADVIGIGPRWSPTGEWIAYIRPNLPFGPVEVVFASPAQGPIRLVHPDGSGDHALGSTRYALGLDWSPDGKYLVARSEAGVLEVIDIATGQREAVPWSENLRAPAWRP